MKKSFSALLVLLFLFVLQPVQSQTNLNSLPGSPYVIYLDFDGHSDNSGWWSSATFPDPVVTAASSFNSTQIIEVFNRVAEDYRPFNINITTEAAVYAVAAVANKQRVVITANSEFYTNENGGAGGVAYRFTFGGGEIACYVFTNFLGGSEKNAAEAASHEAGHTLGLAHHSKYNSDCTKNTEYNPGKGTGMTKWAPIMGNSYSSIITGWYKGASNGATCTTSLQDDLAIITTGNGFSFRTDDFGNTLATAATLSFSGTNITRKGIISTNTDVDAFKITIATAGFYSFFTAPTAYSTTTYSGANLDVKMWLTNSTGTVLFTANDTTRLDATLSSLNLAPGTYYAFVEGVGVSSYVDIGGTGANDYGSIGEYTLTVNKLCTPVITSTTPGTRCGPGMVVLAAATSAGTINWYATSSSTTVLGTGATFITPSLFSSTSYFVGATAAGCSTASARVQVAATVNTQPVANAGQDYTVAQNSGNLTLTGSPVGGTWTGMGVSSTGVFNPNRTPGTYLLSYCVTSNTCTDCDTASVTVTAPPTQVANPVITPGNGTYTSAQTVTITCSTPGTTLYYTISGNTPLVGTGFTRLYTGPFQVTQTTTVKAMGVATGLTNSSVTSVQININNPTLVATPVISPATGSFSGQQTVTITCPTAGATIYYTTNGNVPSSTLNTFTRQYTGPFTVNTTTTVRAMGLKSGMTNSGIAVSYITITNPTATVATPVITPGTGTYTGAQTVSISCATAGSTIYYTTSGNTPVVGTSFTRIYSAPFPVSISTTVRAMGTATGKLNSAVAVAYLTLSSGGPLPFARAVEEPIEEETGEGSFRLYPNPGSGLFFLEIPDSDFQQAEVVNASGQVRKVVFPEGENSRLPLDLRGEVPGLYLVRISGGGRLVCLKLVLQ